MTELENPLDRFENIPDGHKSGYVAVIGRPNVGKSTLMNALLRDKVAIVTPRPQTTRVRQLGILSTEQYQIIFMDTPGMLRPRHKLDEFMMDTVNDTIVDADVIVWLVDSESSPGPGDEKIAERLRALPDDVPVILGINKNDLLKPDDVLSRNAEYRALLPDADWIMFSALEQRGTEELLEMVLDKLPEGPRFYPIDQVTDLYLRDLAAELIREQIMLQLKEEIPYGVAVQILEFKERDNGVTYISANIFVERQNHKQIIIGKKGRQLRSIGAEARKEIEVLLDGGKVFLELWVKVAPKWRRDAKALRRFGYSKSE